MNQDNNQEQTMPSIEAFEITSKLLPGAMQLGIDPENNKGNNTIKCSGYVLFYFQGDGSTCHAIGTSQQGMTNLYQLAKRLLDEDSPLGPRMAQAIDQVKMERLMMRLMDGGFAHNHAPEDTDTPSKDPEADSEKDPDDMPEGPSFSGLLSRLFGGLGGDHTED